MYLKLSFNFFLVRIGSETKGHIEYFLVPVLFFCLVHFRKEDINMIEKTFNFNVLLEINFDNV